MFKGKVAVVTGSAQGIGREIALQFAMKGVSLGLLDMNLSKLQEVEKELNNYSPTLALGVDITNFPEVEKCVNKIVDKFKRIDILINNAGITKDNLILRLKEKDWDDVLSVNLKGAFNCSKVVAKYMVKQRYGKIINISSIIGIIGNVGQSNYSASKAGLIGFTKSLARELGPRKINVNAVAPGYIKTSMTEQLSEEVRNQMLNRISLGRMGTPLDVAKAVLFLASDDSDYITGQILVVDGGMI